MASQSWEFERFFALSLDLLCIAGFDGYFKELNPSWERTLGFTVAELISRPYIDFIHPADRDRTLLQALRLTSNEAVISFDNRYVCKDRSSRWLSWNAVSVARKKVIYAVARDVTYEHLKQERLLEAASYGARPERTG